MIKNVEELKELIIWARENGVSVLRVGEVEVSVSPKHSPVLPRPTPQPTPVRTHLLEELEEFGA
jgi:hypothetical protein